MAQRCLITVHPIADVSLTAPEGAKHLYTDSCFWTKLIPMAAKLVTSSFIKSLEHGGKSISVEYATKTTAWQRYLCATELQNEFAAVTEENKSQLPPGTALVAMK